MSPNDDWCYVFVSVQGTSHLGGSTPCQDASLIQQLNTGSEPVLVLLAADGAGSATHSDTGSKLVCSTVIQLISRWLESRTLAELNVEIVREWFRTRIREVLEIQAEASDCEIRDFATTIVCAVVGISYSAFFQLGDGAIVISDPDKYRTVFWPQSGEYANTTYFVTDDGAPERLMFTSADAIDEIALFTDGLQMLALDYGSASVHQPFFTPMFSRLRLESPGESLLSAALEDFLNSPAVNSRTDDDKTLLLATRRLSVNR